MDAFMAMIMLWGPNWAPQSWALCQGQLIAVNQNPALYSLLGTMYGGDGVQTFALPDFQGRVPVGAGRGPGLSPYVCGQKGGTESITLNATQMPSHNHGATFTPSGSVSVKASPAYATESIPGTNGATTLAATGAARTAGTPIYNNQDPTVEMNIGNSGSIGGSVTVGATGGSMAHENRQPFTVVSVIICLEGLYPPRS